MRINSLTSFQGKNIQKQKLQKKHNNQTDTPKEENTQLFSKKEKKILGSVAVISLMLPTITYGIKTANNNRILNNEISKINSITNELQIDEEQKDPVVAVIDNFLKEVDIDKDGKYDISHGRVVSYILQENNPNVKIMACDNGNSNAKATNLRILEILDYIKTGKRIDAVNVSLAKSVTFEDLSTFIGAEITPENICEYKNQIVETLKTRSIDHIHSNSFEAAANTDKNIAETIINLEKVIEAGVPVYIAAGNDGKDSINLLTLVDGAIIIGAKEDGAKASYSADNCLIDRWVDGTATGTLIKENDQIIGFDITKDGVADIKKNELSDESFLSEEKEIALKGTSVASPRAIAQDLQNQN